MRAAGARVARPGRGGDCCGALHLHAGREKDAQRLAKAAYDKAKQVAKGVYNSAHDVYDFVTSW